MKYFLSFSPSVLNYGRIYSYILQLTILLFNHAYLVSKPIGCVFNIFFPEEILISKDNLVDIYIIAISFQISLRILLIVMSLDLCSINYFLIVNSFICSLIILFQVQWFSTNSWQFWVLCSFFNLYPHICLEILYLLNPAHIQ